MTQYTHSRFFLRNRKERRERMLFKMRRWREAKERKRQERIAAGWEPEPKLVRFHRFEFAVKDKLTGEVEWHDLVSVRHAKTALGLILKFCQ